MTHLVLTTPNRQLVSMPSEDRDALARVISEVCNDQAVPDIEFESRYGASRTSLRSLRQALLASVLPSQAGFERADAWVDGASVMIRAHTVYGDPVELSTEGARAFAEQLDAAIRASD